MNIVLLIAAVAIPVAKAPEFTPTEPIRNPFWQVGYQYAENELEPITTNAVSRATARKEPEKAAPAEEPAPAEVAEAAPAPVEPAKPRPISAQNWVEARKQVRCTGKTSIIDPKTGAEKTAFIINGNSYKNGDLISINHEGHRFTWRINHVAGSGKLQFQQVKVVKLED